ncbi:hypothetical protein [Brevundimonas sp.]|jgi:hypothetical protein|uniref:hypothetical protein n=1 Tax=Brevundimonas sp. TaxID=1871086 RepID=UPI00262A28C3|nr:hypothetical protein [Brevundimonas sp.]
MDEEPKTCVSYVRRFWPLLLARWAVFAALMVGGTLILGRPLAQDWPLILLASGTLNVMWIWVA